MRAAFCVLAVMLGFASLASAQDDSKDKYKNEKRYRAPQIDFNGFNARFSADQSNIWQTPDPSTQYQSRQDPDAPVVGLTISRPFQF
jgi:hypothetical protein